MTIKAITFDFWQTLYQNRPVDWSERALRLKADVEQASGRPLEQAKFEVAVKVARDTWNRIWVQEHRTADAREWLGVMLQYLGLSIGPADLLPIQQRMEESVLIDTPILVDEAREALAQLSTRYQLAVISDTGITPGRVLRQILESDGLVGYFSHLTFSDEVGRSKPHPDAFLSTLDVLGAEPAEAVHVGDLLRTDIAGAQGVGMRGVQYIGLNHDGWPTTTDQFVTATVTPDAIIRRHTELPELLKSWNNSA